MRLWFYAASLWIGALAAGVWCAERQLPTAAAYLADSQAAHAVGDTVAAERSLRRALARNEHHAAARVALSEIANHRGDWTTVTALLQPIPDDDPLAPLARVAEGDAWRELGYARRARESWTRAERLDPNGTLSRLRLLFLEALQLRRDDWQRRLWDLYDRGEYGVAEMVQLLVSRYMVWETVDPIAILEGYVAADPDDLASRTALAQYWTRAGRLAEARNELEGVLAAAPTDSEAWLAYLECLLAAAERADFERALERAPRQSLESTHRFWRARGTGAMLANDLPAAVEHFRRAIAMDLYDPGTHHKLALTLRQLGRSAEAPRHTYIATRLALIERLCLTLRVGIQRVDLVRELVRHCEKLLLIEESLGWTKIGLGWSADDAELSAARRRLAAMRATSSRRQPRLEEIGWRD